MVRHTLPTCLTPSPPPLFFVVQGPMVISAQLNELCICLPPGSRDELTRMISRGKNWHSSLESVISSSVKGSWTRAAQTTMVDGMMDGTVSVVDQLSWSRKVRDRQTVDPTKLRTSLRYWNGWTKLFGLPGVLPPSQQFEVTPLLDALIQLFFTFLKAKVRNSKSGRIGEASGSTMRGHVSRILTAHSAVFAQWPCMNSVLNALEKGHDRQMVDLNGKREKKKATPTNVEIYVILTKMDWTGICPPAWKMTYVALFTLLWEGLLRQASLLQTKSSQRYHHHWYASLSHVYFIIPPNRTQLPPSIRRHMRPSRHQGL